MRVSFVDVRRPKKLVQYARPSSKSNKPHRTEIVQRSLQFPSDNYQLTKDEQKIDKKTTCVIWESNPGLPDVTRMATENFTTKPITPFKAYFLSE